MSTLFLLTLSHFSRYSPNRWRTFSKTLSRSSFLQLLTLNMGRSPGSLGGSAPRQWKGSALVAVRGSKASRIAESLEAMMLENSLRSKVKYHVANSLTCKVL